MKLINRIVKVFLLPYIFILKRNKSILEYVLAKFRKDLVDISQTYPSIVNNGYLHIEKSISLIKELNLNEKNLIVDVGAATGIVSMQFAKSLPQSKVYSFEPLKTNFESLVKLTAEQKNIVTINKGLGQSSKVIQININERITTSSIFPTNKDIESDYFAENLKMKEIEELNISTLDDEIPDNVDINLIKLDVQGYELEVLKGAENCLKRTRLILIEMMNHDYYKGAPMYNELDSYLTANNFELWDIIPSIRQNNKLMEWDAIYSNRKVIG